MNKMTYCKNCGHEKHDEKSTCGYLHSIFMLVKIAVYVAGFVAFIAFVDAGVVAVAGFVASFVDFTVAIVVGVAACAIVAVCAIVAAVFIAAVCAIVDEMFKCKCNGEVHKHKFNKCECGDKK